MIRLPRLLHEDTVTVISEGGTGEPDEYGVPTRTPTEFDWVGVNVQQIKTTELADHQREQSADYYRVAGPLLAADTISPGAKIRWRGTEYRVEGEPDHRAGRGRIEHTSLIMYRVRG